MKDGAVIASAKCVADFVERRFRELARQIHRDLARKGNAGRAPFARHIGQTHVEMFRHTPLNLLDRDGMPRFLLQNVLQQMFDDFLRELLSTE